MIAALALCVAHCGESPAPVQQQVKPAPPTTAARPGPATTAAPSPPVASIARLKLDSLRPVMSGLVAAQSIGKLWFTNVSPRSGVVCVQGTAVNEKTKRSARSLPACTKVEPYASAVAMELMFAGQELAPVCPDQSACRLVIDEAPEPRAAP
jgi:hypothetical protein